MPIWIPVKFDMKTNVFLEVLGTPENSWDNPFDSALKVSVSPALNHMLTLNLRIFLDKFMPPFHLRSWIYMDDTKAFVVGPWNHAEWHRFLQGFLKQCAMWNNKFWLLPPADFSKLDLKVGGKTIRPNVYCNLNVEIVPNASRAHRTIKVVNLDGKSAARKGGKREADVTSGDFRSDSTTYDVFDIQPRTDPYSDASGNTHKVRHYTIAHEIGHALGQEHIGVIRHETLCDMAVLMDDAFNTESFKASGLTSPVPAMFSGGSNSNVCYGDFADASVSANIMGGGGTFTIENAQPWLEQIPRHTQTTNAWTASRIKVPPKTLP